ncbi:AAA family ATPase [Kutzneria viridogrisea]
MESAVTARTTVGPGTVKRMAYESTSQFPTQVRETHCATVFFLGDRAYKMKKPVALGFLDFSTPEARRAVCHREVELNRRLAPDVYLGVAEVLDTEGTPCEWLVVMRRMPAERSLAALVRSGAQVRGQLRDLARQLAAFHARAERGPRIEEAGSVRALRERWGSTLAELRTATGEPLRAEVLAEITTLAQRYLDGREPLFRARISAGAVCDGHGDLLAEDVFCLPDGPRALDCLEFDDRLRWVDGLDDAAFLAMDLERLDRRDLAAWFLAQYQEFSGMPCPPSLTDHYIAYRAVVRAKVACLRHAQGAAGQAEQARLLADIARRHLRAAAPRLVLVGGQPGTGKSTLGGALADRIGAVLLRSDRVRKEIADRNPLAPSASGWEQGLYSPAHTARTYQELLRRARHLLGHGESVVLDASWRDAAERERAGELAHAVSAALVELECRVPRALADARIRARTADPSDATTGIAGVMAAHFHPWPRAGVIDTSGPVAGAAEQAALACATPFHHLEAPCAPPSAMNSTSSTSS